MVYLCVNFHDRILQTRYFVCLFDGVQRHFQRYFSYTMAVSFIGGGNRRTRRKPSTRRKSLTNLSHNVVYLALIVIWTHNISILRGNWTSPQRKATRIKAPQTKVTRIKAPLTKTPQKYKLIFFVSYRYFFCVFVCKIFFVFYNLIQNLS
jgi:hypothetical protein